MKEKVTGCAIPMKHRLIIEKQAKDNGTSISIELRKIIKKHCEGDDSGK